MKTLALDIGDVWIGSAISDGAGITCRPYQTVKLEELENFLRKVLIEEMIGTVVVGHPITVGGTVSEQTKKIESTFVHLKEMFDAVDWVLRDERYSSKRAAALTRTKPSAKGRSQKKKEREHSVAAAFVLQSYLDYKAYMGG